jgi:SAM-dependent MidA family methyltransferase
MMERFDHFMARANAAYYAARDPFQDFVTAPEIFQVFGEVIGGWAKVVWGMMGAAGPKMLVEAGPGRGVMMADMLRVFGEAEVHFIETSPKLRTEQAKHVPGAIWHDTLADVPDRPMILIANEFLDALPVRQFVRRPKGWLERYVEAGAYVELPADQTLPDDPIGSVREVNEAAQEFVRETARRGVGLFIDYGPEQNAAGESVQAIRDGKYADPLVEPGTADITAHVDFAALSRVTNIQGPVKQNAFLTALGLFQRTDFLAQKNPAKAENLRLAARRLTAPDAMGSLFKVMAVCPPGFPTLPGFEG